MSDYTDENLLKRASQAGTNLIALALLASLVAIGGVFLTFSAKGIPQYVFISPAFLAIASAFLAAGFWVLSIAARRGNPTAVTIVIVAMGVQLALSFTAIGLAATRSHLDVQPNMFPLIVAILAIVALGKSRTALLELQDRGLSDKAFVPAKPSKIFCVIGGSLLVTGYIVFNTATGIGGWQIGNARTREFVHAKAFIQMTRDEEKAFLKSLPAFGSYNNATLDGALRKLAAVERKLDSIKKAATDVQPISRILETYGNAVRQWKGGLALLSSSTPDPDRAMEMFQLGDKLRMEARHDFDLRYARNNK